MHYSIDCRTTRSAPWHLWFQRDESPKHRRARHQLTSRSIAPVFGRPHRFSGWSRMSASLRPSAVVRSTVGLIDSVARATK